MPFQERRKKLLDQLGDNFLLLVQSGELVESTDDETYLFEPIRNFVYLTGQKAPGAMYLAYKVAGKVTELLLMHIPSEMEQRWQGTKFDPEAIRESTGIQRVVDSQRFEDLVSRLLYDNDIQHCYINLARWKMSYAPNPDQRLANRLREAYPYLQIHNVYHTICKMRTVKDEYEIRCHRKACQITEEAVKHMMRNMKPGMTECQIEAYYDFVLKSYNVKPPAFATIAAAGKNACVMHYVDNDTPTRDGQLILFDLGAQWEFYCADVSRTFPVNGRFTPRQKKLYNVVLKGLEAAEALSRPGQKKNELQAISKQVMAEELVKIGKIEKPEEIDKYYFHGSGHYIGLNTHDVGDQPDAVLQENTVFTLEPGLYFDDEEIGIRIEDTILVTKDGCEILSAGIPKTVEEIEAFLQG